MAVVKHSTKDMEKAVQEKVLWNNVEGICHCHWISQPSLGIGSAVDKSFVFTDKQESEDQYQYVH